jgi:hypothetical protein
MNPNRNNIKALRKALCPGTPFEKIEEPMVRGGVLFLMIYMFPQFLIHRKYVFLLIEEPRRQRGRCLDLHCLILLGLQILKKLASNGQAYFHVAFKITP